MSSTVFTGQSASGGTALGFAYRTDRGTGDRLPHRRSGNPVEQVSAAFDAVATRMRELAESLRSRGQGEQAEIMDVAGYIADDPDLRAAAIRHVADGNPVTVAISRAVDTYATALAELDDPVLAERAADVRQIGKRALAWLHGTDDPAITDGPLVLLAHEITAADLLEPAAPVVAAASVTGGPNSHAAIVARSLGIPLLLGIDRAVLDCADGVEILVDGGEAATLTTHPQTERRQAAVADMARARAVREADLAQRNLPCVTRDGREILLRANVGTPADAANAMTANADGVGLLRTELPFLDAAAWPSYLQHTGALAPIFRRLGNVPVTVRTLDFADDKLPPFLGTGRIGRGLPLMLAEPDAFREQFRAILTAGAAADLRIMIPMVANVDELRACRELLNQAAEAIGRPAPPLGAMIELPEAVADIARIAKEAEFISIGSNDLTCQILGLDRRDSAASPAAAAHPAVLRAIDDIVTAAHAHRRQVSVCGDAAADPHVLPLLVGLGCDILSVAPSALDRTRAHVRRLDYASAASSWTG